MSIYTSIFVWLYKYFYIAFIILTIIAIITFYTGTYYIYLSIVSGLVLIYLIKNKEINKAISEIK